MADTKNGEDIKEHPINDKPASGGDGVPFRRPQRPSAGPQDEEELASKMLQIQAKRFYLDVKQNRRGRFLKVAEVGAGGRKTRVVMSMPSAGEFREHLSAFADFYSQLGPPSEETSKENPDGRLKSVTMVRDNRRYYLDLKENERGRFLRVTQTMQNGPRNAVVIPAQGLIEFRDSLTKLLEEFGTEDVEFQGKLPESKQFRVENKSFYFDIGQNQRGVFMRISEVKPNFRTAVTVPERSWTRFRDIFIDLCDSMGESADLAGGGGDGASSGKGGDDDDKEELSGDGRSSGVNSSEPPKVEE